MASEFGSARSVRRCPSRHLTFMDTSKQTNIRVAVCAYKQVRLEEMADLAMRMHRADAADVEIAMYIYEHLDLPDELMRRLETSGLRLLRVDTGSGDYRHANLIDEHYKPLAGGAPAGASPAGRVRRFLQRAGRSLLRRLGDSSLARIFRERRYLRMLRLNYRNTRPLFREFRPDVMMVTGDRHRTMEPVLLKIAKELGARILISYVAFYAEPEELADKYREHPPNPPGFFPLYDRLAERRLRHTSRGDAWFYPHWQARALQKFGTLSPNPWVMGAGLADVLCLPNAQLRESYRRYDIDPAKLRVVGDVSFDRLYRGWEKREDLRGELAEKYGLDADRPVVVLALPPLAEHGDLDWEAADREIELLVRSACQLEANTLVSLHPKMDRGRYISLEERHPCRIMEERLGDTLPAADFFMASFSSTVLWAVLCGVKSAVVDFYGFGYDYFDAYDSIKVISSRQDLSAQLDGWFHSNIDFEADWKRMGRDKIFFGRTVDNYLSLIRELA